MEAKELVYFIADLILQKKGTDIKIINLEGKTSVTDYFIVCSALSTMQVKAIADNILQETKKAGESAWRDEGYRGLTWILIDYIDVVVHVFMEETRKFYNLEGLWGDAEITDVPEDFVYKKTTVKKKVTKTPKTANKPKLIKAPKKIGK
ncbi:MAG: ribosome silencing factor [Candidatus Kapaibacterium sp.]